MPPSFFFFSGTGGDLSSQSPMNLYRIKNWNDVYENNRSRTVKDLSWVPIPNRHDGEAYSRLMVQNDASIIFTVWILLLQVASRCHPRGSLLTSSCQPHNPESLAIKTRGKQEWFEKSIPFLVQIGWLEEERQEGVSVLTSSCQSGDEERTERTERKKEGIEIVKKINSSMFKIPENLNTERFRKTWEAWIEFRCKLKSVKNPSMFTEQLEKLATWGEMNAYESLKNSMMNGWQGIFEPKNRNGNVVIKKDVRKSLDEYEASK